MKRSASSTRTGTAQWKRVRTQRLTIDRENGLTNCPECGVWLEWEQAGLPNSVEVDHITPASQGGQDTLDNTRTICRLSNQRLGGKLGGKRMVYNAERKRYQTVIDW